MSFFFGFIPDNGTNRKIAAISEKVKEVFKGFEIDVRWSKPASYHLTVVYLGENINFLQRLYFKYRVKNLKFNKFLIKFGGIKLGVTRRYKELIFLEVQEGGDEMRKLCLTLRELLGLKKDVNLISHLTLGRINKDLSDQEYSNVVKDLSLISAKIKKNEISFYVDSIDMIEVKDGKFTVLMKIDAV